MFRFVPSSIRQEMAVSLSWSIFVFSTMPAFGRAISVSKKRFHSASEKVTPLSSSMRALRLATSSASVWMGTWS